MRTSRRDSDRSAAEPFARKLSSIVRRSSAFLHGDDVAFHQWSDNQSHEAVGASKSFGLHYLRRFSRATTTTTSNAMTIDEIEPSLGLDGLVDPERQRRRTLEAMSFHVLHTAFAPPRVIERAPSSDSDSNYDVDADDDDDDVGAATWGADDNQNNGEGWMVGVDSGNVASEQSQQHVDDEEDDECKAAADMKVVEVDESLRRLSRVPTDGLDDNEDSRETFAALLRGDGGHEIKADEGAGHADEELRFDEVNLTASVRKLVRRIEQASSEDLLANSAVSNQDEDAVEIHESHVELLPSGGLERQASALHHQDHLKLPELPSGAFVPAHDARLLAQSCYIPMDDVQDELTSSMRRLVIGLKKDSEATNDDSSGLGARLSSRRRGNSCPAAYRPTARSSAADSTASTAASVSMETGAVDQPARQRKRSAFARLAPKILEPFRRKRKSYLFTDEELESVEGARWKIVELAFRFGGKHRFYLVQAVNMFFPLVKYGRRGGPHPTRLHCNRCGTIQWQHKRGGLSEAVDLADVLKVLDGRQTAVFRKYASSPEQEASSLSLIFKERTLDLETQSASHRDWLMSALRTLVTYARKQRQLEQRAIAERGLLTVDELSGSGSSVGHPMPATVLSPHQSSPRMLW